MIVNDFANLGYIVDKLPDDVLKIIKEHVEQVAKKMKEDPSLAPHSIEEIFPNEPKKRENYRWSREAYPELYKVVEPYIKKISSTYKNLYKYPNVLISAYDNGTQKNMTYVEVDQMKMDCIWANFQKKHQWLPMHMHNALYSFIIYINIPYDIKEELNHPDYQTAKTGAFINFIYTNVVGRISKLEIALSKEWEGSIIFFPGDLNHVVYPFVTSDGYRISVAGNVVYDDGGPIRTAVGARKDKSPRE